MGTITKEKTVRYFLSQLGLFAGLLAISGAALADFSGDFATVPEPGVLELVGIGAAAMILAKLARRRK